MTDAKFRVLWVCGAPGAGKSVAAWGVFERSAAAGSAVAFVDVDQLGMLYPATHEDPYRYGLKSAAVDALIPGYIAAGAHTLIVSGVVDPVRGPALEADIELRVCLLSPGGDELRRRLIERGWQDSDAQDAVAEDAVLRTAGYVDDTLDTSKSTIEATVDRLERFLDHSPHRRRGPAPRASATATTEVLVITGPRAAGTSTVGFGLATRTWRAGRRVGFLDMQQLGFVSDRSGGTECRPDLAIHQLATMHRVFAESGPERLVVSAHLAAADHQVLKAVFESAQVRIVRLRADEDTLKAHVLERTGGSGARLAADDLINADQKYQARIVQQALVEQELLDHAAVEDLVFDVSGRTPSDAIEHLKATHIW